MTDLTLLRERVEKINAHIEYFAALTAQTMKEEE